MLVFCLFFIASALAEPPVNRYLPPQGSIAPSSTYGVPGFPRRQTDAVFRGRPSPNYVASQLRNQYLPPQEYGAPEGPGFRGQGFGQSFNQFSGAPNTQYGAPSSQYGAPSTQYGAPSQYTPMGPSSQYGAPGFGGNAGNFGLRGANALRQYLPPGAGRGGYDDGSNGEPANYDFQYMVRDDPSGNDFGHRESRRGDRAEGEYYALLPDGRKQKVVYEADQDGYRPQISYEDTGISRYNANGLGYSGYPGGQSGPY